MLDKPPWSPAIPFLAYLNFHHVDCFVEVDSTFPTMIWVRSTHFPFRLWPVHTRLGLAHSDLFFFFFFRRRVDLSSLFLVVFDGLSASFTSWVNVNDSVPCDAQ